MSHLEVAEISSANQCQENVASAYSVKESSRAIAFILSFKFFERFCVQSIRTLLVLYLTTQLGLSANNATIVYHIHCTLIFSMGIVGAIMADSWLGKFHTILYMHIFSMIGMALFVLTAVQQLDIPFRTELTVLTLVMLSIGNGCLKPCVTALGGDQFSPSEQSEQVESFFSKFYFVLKLSAVGASLSAPIMRSDIPSLSAANGYLLAFGVSFGMFVIGLAIFLGGLPFYKKLAVSENMILRVTKCIGSGIKGKWQSTKHDLVRLHWLDYASETHCPIIVNETKILLNTLVMLTPLPMFWALNEQTSSIIPLQAARMNGDLAFYKVKPDQLQLAMQLLVMLMIPLCDLILYPVLARVGIVTGFQKIAVGGFVSMFAFITAGVLETHMHSVADPLHMVWILPQYVMLALVEAVVGVQSMVFANVTAPKSLKTVIQAAFLATHGLGNMYDVIVIGTCSFSNEAHLFFLFAGLMLANTLLFIALAMRYKKVEDNIATT